jgi:hypothetical protein
MVHTTMLLLVFQHFLFHVYQSENIKTVKHYTRIYHILSEPIKLQRDFLFLCHRKTGKIQRCELVFAKLADSMKGLIFLIS